MSKTDQIIDKFASLIDMHVPQLKIIVWDLDGTLGRLPGWAGKNLTDYIKFDDDFNSTVPMFKKLGFQVIEQCYRKQPQRSKTNPFKDKDTVMLIDDQWYECERAIQEGCHAMHLQDHIGRGFLNNKFIVYVHE